MTRRLVPVLLTSFVLGLAACGSDDDSGSTVASTATEAQTTASTATEESTPTTAPEPTTTEEAPAGAGECKQVAAQKPLKRDSKKPTSQFSASKTYVVTMKTSCGDIELTLDVKNHPITATSFGTLVKDGFYDGLGVLRVAPGFVLQAGDPTASQSGGASYDVVEEPGTNAKYPKYTLAMAKSGADPVGSSSSQFFIMTGDGGLPPEYAIAGKVTKGQAVVDAIGAIPPADGAPDGPPSQDVIIEKATLAEK
ncbi:putative peptidyl-prolyl cis-trans isomerase B [Paraconexibacter sp. AEG42_29]|uniref:peptidylprolyl isomerase n=1 Tax=Paraconexibacter sp. AEG42_29 TaxID=2997339 RepID=A0AAU7AVI6_9ACTN